jgi:uridine kinase
MTEQRLTRPKLLATLADALCAITSTHPLRVGVDGIDASEKTTLADELSHHIQQRHRPPLRASVDAFHHHLG